MASKNLQKILEVQTGTERNAIDILKNAVQISERRENINSVQEEINKNQSDVAEMISVKNKRLDFDMAIFTFYIRAFKCLCKKHEFEGV